MINEHGTVFLLKNTIEFAPQIEKQTNKTLKRFIYIAPSILQKVIDEQKSGMNDEHIKSAKDIEKSVSLSVQKEKIWGKKFLIRLISKQSNKKIDLRLKFRHDKILVKDKNK